MWKEKELIVPKAKVGLYIDYCIWASRWYCKNKEDENQKELIIPRATVKWFSSIRDKKTKF